MEQNYCFWNDVFCKGISDQEQNSCSIGPWVSLGDVTLLVGVHKYLLNFWFKRVEDCYIRVSQIVKIQKWGASDFCL